MQESLAGGAQQRRWRLFYTFPRAEKKCERLLRARAIKVFLPVRTVVHQWSDRKKEVVELLFPGYLFAHVDEAERLQVLKTPGIQRCVRRDRTPVEVAADEIEQLRIAGHATTPLTVTEQAPRPAGPPVTLHEGPLKGLTGEVVREGNEVVLLLHVGSLRCTLRLPVPHHAPGATEADFWVPPAS